MRDVFNELTKETRDDAQVLIGSPGVGKSVLLFLVAIYQTLNTGKPIIFVRKTRFHLELTSVFFMEKVLSSDGQQIKVSYDREVDKNLNASDVAAFVIKSKTKFRKPLGAIADDDVMLFLDGPHEGDADLINPYHYLATSGGFDVPHGEAAMSSTLVVLGGWQKEALRGALTAIGIPRLQRDDEVDTAGQENEEVEGEECIPLLTFEEVYYHTGGRIRDAVDFVKDPQKWKSNSVISIKSIAKEKVFLSLVGTNSSERSADRLRTLFRNSDGANFLSCVQIVDSQFFAHLLQDRAGLEQYLNAYKHAKVRGLSSVADCHFEELLHQLFHKRPKPIMSVTQGTGTGADEISQLDVSSYWIPSTPNFANIDAAVVLNDGMMQTVESQEEAALENESMETDEFQEQAVVGLTTFWCLQYTVANKHSFNSTTFRTKFLKPVCQKIGLSLNDTNVNVVFIVPTDVGSTFKIPEEVKDSGYNASLAMVDCSNTQTVESFLKELPFIEQPVSYVETASNAPSVFVPPPAAAAKRQRQE